MTCLNPEVYNCRYSGVELEEELVISPMLRIYIIFFLALILLILSLKEKTKAHSRDFSLSIRDCAFCHCPITIYYM